MIALLHVHRPARCFIQCLTVFVIWVMTLCSFFCSLMISFGNDFQKWWVLLPVARESTQLFSTHTHARTHAHTATSYNFRRRHRANQPTFSLCNGAHTLTSRDISWNWMKPIVVISTLHSTSAHCAVHHRVVRSFTALTDPDVKCSCTHRPRR